MLVERPMAADLQFDHYLNIAEVCSSSSIKNEQLLRFGILYFVCSMLLTLIINIIPDYTQSLMYHSKS